MAAPLGPLFVLFKGLKVAEHHRTQQRQWMHQPSM